MAKNAKNKKTQSEVVLNDNKKKTEEKIKKEKKEKINYDKINSAIKAVDDRRVSIILFVVGFLIATLLFRCILWPDRIATLKDGTQPVVNLDGEVYTADDLYEDMKERYSVNILINSIDNIILSKLYEEDSDMTTYVNQTAESYFSYYEQLGYTKEEFLSIYSFSSEDAFRESLKLDYRRDKYYEDYALGLVTDKEIENYYKNDVFGDVDSEHILVSIDEDNGLSDDEAKELVLEIINKLNSGKTWDEVVEEYKDETTHEELGYQAFNASLESTYLNECRDLEVGAYSKSPIKTSYGYHIVYKVDQKDKPELDTVKDSIKEILAEQKKNDDENLEYKALIKMREDAKIEFVDTKFGDAYTQYKNNYK